MSKEFYLKNVFAYDEEQVKFLECVVQVQLSWKEQSEFVVCIIPDSCQKEEKN